MRETDIFEQSLTRRYRAKIWSKFVSGLKEYNLLKPNDNLLVCLSGGKDSLIMGRLFVQLLKHTDFDFKVGFVFVNKNYDIEALNKIEDLFKNVALDYKIININDNLMDTLVNYAKENGFNKIALGQHYDDVIESTLLSVIDKGCLETLLPKEKYNGMDVIRPLYLVREKDIGSWKDYHELSTFEEPLDLQKLKTKELIKRLFKEYNIQVEKNIFCASANVTLDMILGYKENGIKREFVEFYEEI